MGTREEAISYPAAYDELSPLENSLLKPHVNSPVNEDASQEEVIEQTSLHNALIKGMKLRIDEAAWNLQKSRSKQHNDSPIAGTELIRKIFKDVGVEELISSKTPWSEQLKTAAHVRWNLRDLMQREEIEDVVDANLNALRTEYIPKQGSRELGCLEELARSLGGKQYDTKQEDSLGDHGTPRRLELGIAKLKNEEDQLHCDCREDTKTEPNTTPRNQLIPESEIHGGQGQKGRTAIRVSPRQNHVHPSCPGDNCRNADAKEEDDKLFQGKASLPDTRKSVIPNDFCGDSAAVQELVVDWGTDRNDLEVLLQFLTMKQQLRENRKTDVEAVVQTEAIVRELLARMKLDINCPPSSDSDASNCFLPRSNAGDSVVDDNYDDGGRKRREQVRSIDTSDATVRSVSARSTFNDSGDPQVVAVHQNQNIDCRSKPAIRRPPFVVPSSSKSQCSQRMAASTSTRMTTSCVQNYVSQSEYKAATSPSRNSEETRKRSRRSTVGARQPEACRTIQSVVGNAIDVGSEEVKSDGSQGNVVEAGSSTVTGLETVDGTSGATQAMGSAEHDGLSYETKVPHGSPTEDAMSLVSARTLESRLFASNAPVMTPWNYQREKQLPGGHNVQLASPNRRSIPKSPSSPEHRRQCRDSPTRKSSPNNRPSPPTSPQRQQKPRAAMATSKSTAAQLGSPKRPSPLSSPQRQQKPRPAMATSKSTAAQLGSPKRASPLSSPQRQQQKPRPAMATLISTAAQVGSPKPSKTLAKEEADHMMSTPIISTPGSHDPDIFPAGISEAVVQESIALAKDSSDPYVDFRDSMLEMMQEKNLWQRQEDLQDLLQCFLHLNQPVHHQMIHRAFSDVLSFDSPLRYSHQSSKKERSKVHFSRRSSPSRQLYYEVSQPCKSPVRGGG
jgi:uncharacterized protein (TIGR01568 family)